MSRRYRRADPARQRQANAWAVAVVAAQLTRIADVALPSVTLGEWEELISHADACRELAEALRSPKPEEPS